MNDPPQEVSQAIVEKYKADSGYEPLSKWLVGDDTDVLSGTSRRSIQNDEGVLSGTSTMLQPSSLKPSRVAEKRTASKKNQWESEDALIQEWARLRKLDAVAIGATLETPARRACAKRMLAWARPLTSVDIKEALRRTKSRDYEFTWLEKDVPSIRASMPPVVVPSNPIIPLDPSLDDGTPATPEQIEQAKQMFADLLKKTKAV